MSCYYSIEGEYTCPSNIIEKFTETCPQNTTSVSNNKCCPDGYKIKANDDSECINCPQYYNIDKLNNQLYCKYNPSRNNPPHTIYEENEGIKPLKTPRNYNNNYVVGNSCPTNSQNIVGDKCMFTCGQTQDNHTTDTDPCHSNNWRNNTDKLKECKYMASDSNGKLTTNQSWDNVKNATDCFSCPDGYKFNFDLYPARCMKIVPRIFDSTMPISITPSVSKS